MATVLRVPAFKAALATALSGRPALSGVQVARFWLGPATEAEGIYLGNLDTFDLASGTLKPANLGARTSRQRRDDVPEVWVTCQAFRAGAGPADLDDAEARVHVLFDEVDGAIADDGDMSATVDWSPGITWRSSAVDLESGWAVRLVASIQLQSRLT